MLSNVYHFTDPSTRLPPPRPYLRVWGLSIKGSSHKRTVPVERWERVLWQALDLCRDAEERGEVARIDTSSSPCVIINSGSSSCVLIGGGTGTQRPPALVHLSLDFNVERKDYFVNTPILRRLMRRHDNSNNNIGRCVATAPVPDAGSYGALTRRVRVLHITCNNYDDAIEEKQDTMDGDNDDSEHVASGGLDGDASPLERCGGGRGVQVLSLQYCGLSSLRPLGRIGIITPHYPLRSVSLLGCHQLTSLEGITCGSGASLLEEIDVSACPIESLLPLARCLSLRKIVLCDCRQLQTLGGLEHHALLEHVEAPKCRALTSLHALASCPALKSINLRDCKALLSLAGGLGSGRHELLETLDLSFTSITSIAPLSGCCPKLKTVLLRNNLQLVSLEGLDGGGYLFLEEVDASYTAIQTLKPLQLCPALRKVTVQHCRSLTSLEGLGGCTDSGILRSTGKCSTGKCGISGGGEEARHHKATPLRDEDGPPTADGLCRDGQQRHHDHEFLEEVDASGTAITSVYGLLGGYSNESVDDSRNHKFTNSIKKLLLQNCVKLATIDGIEGLHVLEELDVSWCPKVTSLLSLQNRCPALKKVAVRDCQALCGLEGLEGHPQLEEVNAANTAAITSVDALLQGCGALKQLVLYGCRDGICGVEELKAVGVDILRS